MNYHAREFCAGVTGNMLTNF